VIVRDVTGEDLPIFRLAQSLSIDKIERIDF